VASATPIPVADERPVAAHKWLIALAVMLGTVLEVLDTSIVNVSLPHMQGSFSASVDEIAWVVTSYLVANGIMIPMTGWISSRFGRKRYFLTSVATFVAASAACGAAQSRGNASVFAGDPDGDLCARRATDGDGDVGRGPDGRADPRTHPGRLDYRQLELALELLHQHPDRDRRPRDGLRVRA
jgi:hypothetical protein